MAEGPLSLVSSDREYSGIGGASFLSTTEYRSDVVVGILSIVFSGGRVTNYLSTTE